MIQAFFHIKLATTVDAKGPLIAEPVCDWADLENGVKAGRERPCDVSRLLYAGRGLVREAGFSEVAV
jgi:hypothetical protein